MYEENVVMLAFSVYIELCIAEVYIKVLYVFQALGAHGTSFCRSVSLSLTNSSSLPHSGNDLVKRILMNMMN